MRSKYYFVYGISITALIVICLLLITKVKDLRSSLRVNSSIVNNCNYEINQLVNGLKNSLLLNGAVMDANSLVTDLKGREFLLKDIVDDWSIVFHYKEVDCRECVIEAMPIIGKLITKYGEDRIIVLTKYQIFRDIVSFIRLNRISIRVFNIKSQSTFETFKGFTEPCVFTINNRLEIRDVFFPSNSFESIFDLYTNTIVVR